METTNELLNTRIDQWCQEKLGTGCSSIPADRLDELKDHLLCVAEARMAEGASIDEAIAYAVEQFGDVKGVKEQIVASQPVFRRWLAKVHCRRATRPAPSGNRMITVSLIYAAALLVTAWILKDGESYAIFSTLIIGTWVVTTAQYGGLREAARAEWRWLKRLFGGSS